MPNKMYPIWKDWTKKFWFKNIHSTGNNIAADTDPNETILDNAIRTRANIKQINPIFQLIISSTPKDVATPFPPLNPKNKGIVCPSTTQIPATCTKTAFVVSSA